MADPHDGPSSPSGSRSALPPALLAELGDLAARIAAADAAVVGPLW
jgi:hypothetical protein